MSEAPPPDQRVLLQDAAARIDEVAEAYISRETIKSRASRGLVVLWASNFEQIEPKGYDLLIESAHQEALTAADGDQLRAAIVMQGWRPPDDVEWQRDVDIDVPIPRQFWKTLPIDDPLWSTGNFLGRLRHLDGFEQNWTGVFMSRADAEACGFPREERDIVEAAPASGGPGSANPGRDVPAPEAISSRSFHRYDAPFVSEIVARCTALEFTSYTAAAQAVLQERRDRGEEIKGASDEAIVRRWQRGAKGAESRGE